MINKTNDTFVRVHKRETPFVQIDKTCLMDTNLSWKAKGLLCYLLSLPNDWRLYLKELVKHSSDGMTATRSAIAELVQYGYMVKQITKGESGRFSGYEYIVYEIPQEIPSAESPELENLKSDEPSAESPELENLKSENPKSENLTLLINNITDNNITNTTTNEEVVVVHDNIENVKEQIDNTIQGDMDIEAVKTLAKNCGIERITYTINNWEGIVGKQDIQSSVEGFFKRAVENGWKPGNKKAGGIGMQRHNFDERPYDDTYFQGFFSNAK